MARQRDHAAEYRRKQELARQEGYRSAAERTKARKLAAEQAAQRRKEQNRAKYQRRNERARKQGYSSYWEQRQARKRVAEAFANIKEAFGNRQQFNGQKIQDRLHELEVEELDEVIETTPEEMRRVMRKGQPQDHNPLFFYH